VYNNIMITEYLTKIKNDINQSRKTNTLLHIKNFYNNVPKWTNIINNINYKYNSGKESTLVDGRYLIRLNESKDVLAYSPLDLQIMHAVSYKNDNYRLNLLFENNNIISELSYICGHNFPNIKTIVTFAIGDNEYSIHKDDHDVVLLQCEGTLEWRIYDSFETEDYLSYIIKPGDLVFAPRGIIHKAVVTEPRATIIMDHNYE
jgi:hypothetical protein